MLGNNICTSYGITLDLVQDKATLQSTEHKHTANLACKPQHDKHLISITKLAAWQVSYKLIQKLKQKVVALYIAIIWHIANATSIGQIRMEVPALLNAIAFQCDAYFTYLQSMLLVNFPEGIKNIDLFQESIHITDYINIPI